MAELKQEWINIAIEALDKAYVSYSHFPVSACLVIESGKIYQNINIENASFGLANCTERTAFSKAVSEGEKSSTHLVVVGYAPDPISLCGVCRRIMAESCTPDTPATLVGDNDVTKATTVRELLPYVFTGKDP